jgi:micrococcal nuclease
MNKLVIALVVLLSAAATALAAETRLHLRIVGVHDGDTITGLDDAKTQHKIRLDAIDAPELGQPYGQAAKKALSEKVFGKTVVIEAGKKDRWGRTLGAVNVDGKPVAETMVEREARQGRRGLWQDPKAVPPWEWRAGRKRR